MRNRIATVATILLVSCSSASRTPPETAQHRENPPTLAPLPEPSIEAFQQLRDENNLLSKRSIYYRNNEYTVAKQYLSLIQVHAEFLREHPDFALRVEGNCDERGSSTYNLALGQRRADFVKRALVMLGADPRQITAVRPGSGETQSARTQ